jgi:hypothetical protein
MLELTHLATTVMVDPLPENSAMLWSTEPAALASKHRQVMLRAGRAPARLRPSRAELTCSSTATTAVQSCSSTATTAVQPAQPGQQVDSA